MQIANIHPLQRGAVLLVSLIMLIMLTLLGVAAINTSTVNLRVVNNMQYRAETIAAGQQAIEAVLSNPDRFDPTKPAYADSTHIIDGPTDWKVTVKKPVCIGISKPRRQGGDSATNPEVDLYWNLDATAVEDSIFSSAKVEMTQGARIPAQVITVNNVVVTAGLCPD